MGTVDVIQKGHDTLNKAQQEAIAHTDGPLLIIAGPGSGKTFVLVLRALNILQQGMADPGEILLCTFTEKAAFELRDRLSLEAKKTGYHGDLSDLLVGTFNGIANTFLQRYRHHTRLGNNYEVLDDFTQLFFMFDHFKEIIGSEENGLFLGRWKTRWTAIQGARKYFNKITEELIEPEQMEASDDFFVHYIGKAYRSYVEKLFETNRIDLPHQQKLFLELLENSSIGPTVKSKIRFIMVDEYQDTNYIQEQILLQLSKGTGNIAVVGDEDQALYRFRGATVRNILEFPSLFEKCHKVTLTANYRSHKYIVEAYNKYMESWDWGYPEAEARYRFEKRIEPEPGKNFRDYPAVFSIWGENKKDEAMRCADMIKFLKENHIIEDESQVALLLHSVKQDHSIHYLEALKEQGIKTFCPRARKYFENYEIQYMIASFAILLGYYGEGRGQIKGRSLNELATYIDEGITELGRRFPDPHPLAKCLQRFSQEIAYLGEGKTLDRRLADYFYHFLAHEPFVGFTRNENRARNLASFSHLLNIFQTYYHYTVITAKNREYLRFHFFNSFLRLLFEGGINEYEDTDNPMPKGHVQVMTIHQSKGLEFPVVIVGSLSVQLSSPKDVDATLGTFYKRPPFEPTGLITGFDRMRLHYVAFSRAEKILVLTASEQPKPYFSSIWQGLDQWPYVRQDQLKSLFFKFRKRMQIKKTFSFTSDLKVYETCPRQYQFFRFYDFAPARSAEYFFGALVHQTIEDIHRIVLDGSGNTIDIQKIGEIFEFNYRHLINRGFRPIGPKQKQTALDQVMNYYSQNLNEIGRILETEVDVSVEKDSYILVGKIDLLLGDDEKLELLDFKSQPRPVEDEVRLDTYYKQLCIYAHILEQRYNKQPDRLLLYWTGEPYKQDALMSFPYRSERVDEAGIHFDKVVESILNKDFAVKKYPEQKVCKECDLRRLCKNDKVIIL